MTILSVINIISVRTAHAVAKFRAQKWTFIQVKYLIHEDPQFDIQAVTFYIGQRGGIL